MRHVVVFLFAMQLLFIAHLRAASGELIIFTGDPKSVITKDFQEKYLPRIKEMAKAQGITVTEKNIQKGAPEEVVFTPSIYFQNHLGRSLYIGRYAAIDKIKTFIRTVSRLPQVPAPNEKHDVLVRKLERATLYTPIKLTPLTGDIPTGHVAEAFHQQALKALAAGASNFTLHAEHIAQRNHRAIYLALYPYLGTDGNFFVSAEMYSQFNCIEPIMKRFDKPFSGPWKDWQKVFEEAGKVLQDEIDRQLTSTVHGDGLLPVPVSTPVKSWDDLGLSLPKTPGGITNTPPANIPLGTRWEYAGPVDPQLPALTFSFMAPLDNYAGEVHTLFGNLEFAEGPSVHNALGKFGIETNSLTMGDGGLDGHVQQMIGIWEHPKAYFTFEKILAMEHPQLAFGTLTQVSIAGQLDFMGIQAPLEVTAQMEPVLDDAGAPRILVNAAFSLRLKDRYGLDGPDGPQPAADTMQFLLNFLLKPAT